MAVKMSKKDEDALAAAGREYNSATTDEARAAAHAKAEAIRANYGYSGGTDGSQYIKTGSSSSGSSSSKSSPAGFHASKYMPIDTSGNDYASMAGMSAADLAALKAAGDSYNYYTGLGDSAKADAAHRQAEAIRQKYNYSGGADGSQYIPLDILEQAAPEYTSRYQNTLDSVLDQWLNRDAFSYDPKTDPLYQAMQTMYTREGSRAMQDALGQASARTGGLASSYAVSAANQANNYYLAQLGDKLPELQQLAYEMYLGDADAQARQIQMLQSLENDNYNRYLTELDQWNTDRDFEYGVNRDQIADSRYEDETAWERSQYKDEQEYERLARQAELLASVGDFSGYKALGYTDAQISLLQSAYAAQAATGSKSSNRDSGSDSGSGGEMDYDGLFEAASQSYSPQNYISSNYKKYGFTSSSGLSSAYENWVKSGGAAPSLDYNEDEGIFTYNGEQYSNVQTLADVIDSSNLTAAQKNALEKKFALFGFEIAFG